MPSNFVIVNYHSNSLFRVQIARRCVIIYVTLISLTSVNIMSVATKQIRICVIQENKIGYIRRKDYLVFKVIISYANFACRNVISRTAYVVCIWQHFNLGPVFMAADSHICKDKQLCLLRERTEVSNKTLSIAPC
jgi:hypothetical protein